LKNIRDQSFETMTKTKTSSVKTKTVKERSRDQDRGLEDYTTAPSISTILSGDLEVADFATLHLT